MPVNVNRPLASVVWSQPGEPAQQSQRLILWRRGPVPVVNTPVTLPVPVKSTSRLAVVSPTAKSPDRVVVTVVSGLCLPVSVNGRERNGDLV